MKEHERATVQQCQLSLVVAGYLNHQKTVAIGEGSLVFRFLSERKNTVCLTLNSCQAFYHQSLKHSAYLKILPLMGKENFKTTI